MGFSDFVLVAVLVVPVPKRNDKRFSETSEEEGGFWRGIHEMTSALVPLPN